MESLVVAEIFVDGNRLEHFNDVFLTQRFNQHHEFSIRVNHDVLESSGSFRLDNSKDLIGKGALIKLVQTFGVARETAYEFSGLICEIGMLNSQNGTADLVIKGYSPTILLEDGPRLASFNNKTLKDVVTATMQPVTDFAFFDNINPENENPIKYVCQYQESSFHFLNRLSSDYGELFYYDGSTVIFGHPETMEFVEVIYGEDMSSMQLNLHVEPIEANKYAYTSKKNERLDSRGSPLTGLGEYPQRVVDASNELFPNPDDLPLMQSVETQGEADTFVNKNKKAIAAGLVVLTGTTNNPGIFLGCVADIKISRRNGDLFQTEDYGVYDVIGMTHHITGNGKYYNTFEAMAVTTGGSIPVHNVRMPVAETQMGWIVDNDDPAKIGRVRVRMLWQRKDKDEKTDWIWVMTPDAGAGKDGAQNRGLVVIPEVGDRVMIGFTYNNPDRPFVMGSMFHGKSGSGKANGRTIINNFGCLIQLLEIGINIVDASGNLITIDGNGNISISSSVSISLKCGDNSEIKVTTDTISLIAPHIYIRGTTDVNMCSNLATQTWIAGDNIDINGVNAKVHGTTQTNIIGGKINVNADAKIKITGGGTVEINGALVKLNT
jgi:type VI secretion system secreted protein VgrG